MCSVQVLISAGEASGEMYGAQLIEALRRRAAIPAQVGTGLGPVPAGQRPASTQAVQLDFFGAGGERMLAAGCEIVVDAKDLAVVGITEVLNHLPKILGLYWKLIRSADEKRPALAVVIDAPAFNWRVARQMRKRGIPVVYYVCPQFWAWRQGSKRSQRLNGCWKRFVISTAVVSLMSCCWIRSMHRPPCWYWQRGLAGIL